MSHNYFSAVVPINSTAAQIKKAVVESCYGWNGEAERSMASIAAGMDVNITKGCYTEKEAKDIFESNDDFYWGGYIKAIPFCRTKTSKKMDDLERRMHETRVKHNAYFAAHRVADQKAAYIGCPDCGSKINKDYFVRNKSRGVDACPVCNANLASETTKKTLAGYLQKIKELETQLEAEKKKSADKPTHYLCVCGIHD